MFGQQIKDWRIARERASRVDKTLQELHSFFLDYRDADGTRLSDVGPIDGQSFTILEALREVDRAVAMFADLKLDENKPVPSKPWNGAQAALANIESSSNALAETVGRIQGEERPQKAYTGSIVGIRDTGDHAYPLTDRFVELTTGADALLQSVGSILAVLRMPRTKAISEAVAFNHDTEAAAKTLEAANSVQRDAREALTAIQAQISAISETRTKIEALLRSAETQSNEKIESLQNAVSQIATYNNESAENHGAIKSRLEDITRQASSAEAIAGELNKYQATLEQVQRRVSGLQEAAERTVQIQVTQRDEVQALIAQAEKMLSSATVAGLSTAFAIERDTLDNRLEKAGRSFIFGVIALTIASSFVLAYILNLEFVVGGPSGFSIQTATKTAHKIDAAGVLARSIILIGPLWFTQFAASRYRQLFDLRQQYAHKYNVAFSADGFTKAAEKYRDDITLWVFETIGRNPVSSKRLGRSMDDPPGTPHDVSGVSGFGERLLATLVGGTRKVADKGGES